MFRKSVMISGFYCLIILFAMAALVFSASLYPLSRSVAYAQEGTESSSTGDSPSGQQDGQTASGVPSTTDVSIVPGSSDLSDTAFSPNPVQTSVGETIRWTNDDTQPHTVTSGVNGEPDGKFDSSPNFNPLIEPGGTFEHTFTEAGEYPYYCALHPNQVGTVIVAAATASAPGNQTVDVEGQQLNEGNQSQRIILEYANPNIGLVIGYPENWDVDNLVFERERSVSFYLYQGPNDPYSEEVYVQLNASGEAPYFQSPDMSLDEIAQQLVTYLQNNFNDLQHISTEPGQVAGLPAIAIHYTYSDPSIGNTEAMEVIFKDGDKLYDFIYTAKPDSFNTELATFKNMIDSVQIMESSPSSPSTTSPSPQTQPQGENPARALSDLFD